MKITAYKCEDTGKLFEKHTDYKNHRARILRKKHKEEEKLNKIAEFDDWLKKEKEQIHDVSKISEWFLKNQSKIIERVKLDNSHWFYDSYREGDIYTKLDFTRVQYNKETSNSHECPDGGVTNFMRDRTKPLGYPGFSIYLTGKLERKIHKGYPNTVGLNFIKIRTGTGGGSDGNFGYEAKLFLEEWPGLKEQVRKMEEEKIYNILKGR